MRPDKDVNEVFRLAEAGLTQVEIAAKVGMGQSAVSRWLRTGQAAVLASPMRRRRVDTRCPDRCPVRAAAPEPAYAYLLGRYLGNGALAHTGRSVYRLFVGCCGDHPGVVAEEARAAVRALLPRNALGAQDRNGCTNVTCYSKHWPCLLPRLGPAVEGPWPVTLAPWQRRIAVERQPERFARGLVHGEGCCSRAEGRYLFSNRSTDVRRLFCEACDRLGVQWRQLNRYTVSVARPDSVARLDDLVGARGGT